MAGFYLGGKAFSNLFIGSQPVEEVYIGPDLVWSRNVVLPIGPDTMFLGGVASTFNSTILASKLNGDNLTFYRELAGNVYASSSANYGIDAGGFNANTDITSYIDGGRCKAISGSAFQGASNLITASFPSASFIGSNAFYGASNLVSISFPNAVTMSGANGFGGITKIINATFPKLEQFTSYAAFGNARDLVTASFPLVTSVPDYSFYDTPSLQIANFPLATSLGNSAFQASLSLVTASFPLATTIGNEAFQGCTALRLPPTASTVTIGTSSFRECTSLQTANFPKVTTIGVSAFALSTGILTASFVSASVIGASAFNRCSALKVINFPTASTINTSAFQNTGIVTASFPSASIIGTQIFQGCTSLVSASLPLVKSIPYSTFYNDLSLQYINLPGLSGSNALSDLTSFTGVNTTTGTIIVPAEQLTAGGDRPPRALLDFHNYPYYSNSIFQKYWNIRYLTGSSILIDKVFPYTQGQLEAKFKGETTTYFNQSGVTTLMSSSTDYHITASAFSGQSTMFAFIDTGKCTVISASAFANNVSLATASFAGVTTIGQQAFDACRSLRYISLPSLITMSGQYHFADCAALESIDLPQVLNIGAFSFDSCPIGTIAAPKATAIGEFAFNGAGGLGYNGVIIGFPSVKTVGQAAFNNCSNLSQISLPALSGSTALGGSTGTNNVFYGVANFGTITVPGYLSASNGGNRDGDLTYLVGKNWYIDYI